MTTLPTMCLTTGDPLAHVPTEILTAAADALVHAGRWTLAAELLDASTAPTPEDQTQVALAAARAALERDWRTGTRLAPERLAVAEAAVRTAGDPKARWDLDFLRVRQTYAEQLFGDDGTSRFGSEGRDSNQVAGLAERAQRLRDQNLDPTRRGWAHLYLGLITDNLLGHRDATPAHYRDALECAKNVGDDRLAFEAQRHLGDHDRDAGDHDLARERWERSTALSARGGAVSGTLAQQLLLAVLHRDAGDEAGAVALGREIARWAGAIGATRLRAQAQGFVDGVDPTGPPPDGDR